MGRQRWRPAVAGGNEDERAQVELQLLAEGTGGGEAASRETETMRI